jgi:nucleoid DNA-binding protein
MDSAEGSQRAIVASRALTVFGLPEQPGKIDHAKGFQMANLTKREIVVRISNDTGLVQHQVFEVVQRTLDLITDSLARGEDVELRNFGIFEVRLTRERVGRNPNQPGSSFKIPPRATVKFKSGKIMRQKVAKLSPVLKQAEMVKSGSLSQPGR